MRPCTTRQALFSILSIIDLHFDMHVKVCYQHFLITKEQAWYYSYYVVLEFGRFLKQVRS